MIPVVVLLKIILDFPVRKIMKDERVSIPSGLLGLQK